MDFWIFWKGFILGLFIGAPIGFIVLSLCVAAKQGDNEK